MPEEIFISEKIYNFLDVGGSFVLIYWSRNSDYTALVNDLFAFIICQVLSNH